MLARTLLCASVVALLADVAPSCGSRPERPFPGTAWLSVAGPACTCLSGSVDILVDGRVLGTVACDSTAVVEIGLGEHTVTGGERAGFTWRELKVIGRPGAPTPVDLGCPTPKGE